jgi:cytochrome P450
VYHTLLLPSCFCSCREVVTPVKVGPYKLPPGVIVWPMLYALHNTHHNWEDPGVFKPERWGAWGV